MVPLPEPQPQPKKVWATLITNLSYLPGLLTLRHSLILSKTAYPFVALYTPSFPQIGLEALHARGIPTRAVPDIKPKKLSKTYEHDPRFAETWNKLVVFGLKDVGYAKFERVVLLDGDMLVRKNMDELMSIPLDGDDDVQNGNGHAIGNGEQELGNRVFAASHACACNPMKKAHYPAHWVPSNCAFTTQHSNPTLAQTTPVPNTTGVGMLNSGLLVVRPSHTSFLRIQSLLDDSSKIDSYTFPDQELLSEAFRGQWVPLPYVYNALKTMRPETVHGEIWRDGDIKNVHYIFGVKPWQQELPTDLSGNGDEDGNGEERDVLNGWWWEVNWDRQRVERENGITDGH